MASELCDSCGGDSESGKCISCFRADEAFRVRIYRALKDLKGHDPSIVTDFNKFSRPEKQNSNRNITTSLENASR